MLVGLRGRTPIGRQIGRLAGRQLADFVQLRQSCVWSDIDGFSCAIGLSIAHLHVREKDEAKYTSL